MDKLNGPDTYFTIEHNAEGRFTEKMSRFLSFAFSVDSALQAKEKIKSIAREFHDARHVCWAYMIGPERNDYLSTDNGEPSGTAGKPILGQINSRQLTNVAVVVVRYFGGIKLGTPGLIAAYREAASLALDNAGIKEVVRAQRLDIKVAYEDLDKVMRIVKDYDLVVDSQEMNLDCSLTLQVPFPVYDDVYNRFTKIPTLKLI